MKMKKFLIVSVAVLSLFMVGCGKKKEEKKPNTKSPQEIAMEKYAKDYYIKFMNKYLTTPTVSIEALKKTNAEKYTDYDLSDLDKCKDSSYTELVLEEGTNEIKGFVHHLECN
ncbi:MAG: hypothetical protein HFH08_05910 [Bacilli bacterium]|nr:hypothetical protein [Bacilli bacterium]